MQPATYYVPEICVQPLLDARDAFSKLDNKEIPMNIQSFKVGQIVQLSRNFKVFGFKTNHRVDSHGYGIINTSRKILPEYEHLPTNEISKLQRNGIQFYTEEENIELIYTGKFLQIFMIHFIFIKYYIFILI